MSDTQILCPNGHVNAAGSAFCSTRGERLMQLVAHGATTEVGGSAAPPPPPRQRADAPPPPPPRSNRADAPPPPPPRSNRADAPPPPPRGARHTFGFATRGEGAASGGMLHRARASWARFSPRAKLITLLVGVAIVVAIALAASGSGGASYSSADVQSVMSQCEGMGNSSQSCQCVVNHVESVLSPAQFHDEVVAVTPAGESAFGAADRLCGVSG